MREKSKAVLLNTYIMGFSNLLVVIFNFTRSKFNAVYLGADGMGLVYLLTNALGLIGTLSNFGFGTIVTREISRLHHKNVPGTTQNLVRHYQLVSWITGFIGLALTIVCSAMLSKITFNSYRYSHYFILSSAAVLLAQVNTGYMAALEGQRLFKTIAKINISSSVLLLFTGLLVLRFYKVDAIILLVLLSSIIPCLFSYFYFSRLNYTSGRINYRFLVILFKDLVKNGYSISLTRTLPFLSNAVLYFVLSRSEVTSAVGLYSGGFSIIFMITNFMFSAMEAEFFTRISTLQEQDALNGALNFQVNFMLTVITPAVVIFGTFSDYVITTFLSIDFIEVSYILKIATIGLIFKVVTWPILYFYFVKNRELEYFKIDLLTTAAALAVNVFVFIQYGFMCLGIAFLVGQIISFLYAVYKLHKDFHLFLENRSLKYLSIQLGLALIAFLVNLSQWDFCLVVLVLFATIYTSYCFFLKDIGFLGFVKHRILKIWRRKVSP